MHHQRGPRPRLIDYIWHLRPAFSVHKIFSPVEDVSVWPQPENLIMGTLLRRQSRFFLLLAGIALITIATYSCKPSEPANTSNANTTAGASPAPAAPLPPLPSGAQALPSPVVSGNIPRQVVINGNPSTPQDARPFFDNFSWQSFIALNWPAQSGTRAVRHSPNNPNVFLTH